jgi:sugar-specific transcriptional regulator TrmB
VNLKNVLTSNGLTLKQAQVYLALLELQESAPATIAKRAKVKRPTCYLVLEELQTQGLITKVVRGSRLSYRALNPAAFLDMKHRHYAALEAALPDLLKLNRTTDSKPEMRVFEGPEGLRAVMENSLTTRGEICSWANTSIIVSAVFKDYWQTYIRKRVQKGIRTRCIFGLDKTAAEFKRREKAELRTAVHIPMDAFPFDNDINIYDNKLAIISHRDLVGVIIENQSIANTQRSIFNLCFEAARMMYPAARSGP